MYSTEYSAYDGTPPRKYQPDWYEEKLTGGAPRRMRILHWNVCSINTDTKEKVAFIRAAAPIVASIQ
jgi:hypothetical protein